ncbi:hypothetical protein [Vulcanococcus limneticus]|uniref:hypothetical protein n=1 Tax=Vulcanococcus limneticus TaxID=2170428 RepID=UPI00398C2323
MYEVLIPRVLEAFARPDEAEQDFLRRVQASDVRLQQQYRTQRRVGSEIYADPMIRAAYLLRYLGHYTLQLGDVLTGLDGNPEAAAVLSQPHLQATALCGGPGPELIALAALHAQLGGSSLALSVLDHNARHWADCWPIAQAIANTYPRHPAVSIQGLATELLAPAVSPWERELLQQTQVMTAMNCLNELVGHGRARLETALRQRLDALPAGALVLASDQAFYGACEAGIQLLHALLVERGARILLADITKAQCHSVANRFQVPGRIAWIYGAEQNNRFRVHVQQLRLAARMP